MAVVAPVAYRLLHAPAAMCFGERPLTAVVRAANGHDYFNGTMLCNNGRAYNREKNGDDAIKKVVLWENKHDELINKVIGKLNESANQRASVPLGTEGQDGSLNQEVETRHALLSRDDMINNDNARKQTGPMELRGTFVHIALFPALARYICTDFAVHTDAMLSRMFTGDYGVIPDVIDICDAYNGTTTSKMAIDMDEVRESRKRSAREAELEDELPVVRKRACDAEDRVRDLEGIKEMLFAIVKEKNDIIAEKNSLMLHNKELAEYRLQRNAELKARIDSDPHTANANVLPTALDDNTFAERCAKFRQRVRDMVPALVDAAFEGKTMGRTSTARALIQEATGVLCLRMDKDSVNTLSARMMLQRACKIQFGVQYSTHMTAHQVYTVLSRGSKWLEVNIPGSEVTHNYTGTLQTFRDLYGADLEPLKLDDCEDE